MMKHPSNTLCFSSDRLEYLFGAALLKKVNSNPLTVTRFIQNPLKSAQTNILTRPWGYININIHIGLNLAQDGEVGWR